MRVVLPLLGLMMTVAGCGEPPELLGCYERCNTSSCNGHLGVFLKIEADRVDEIAADGSGCRYGLSPDGQDYRLEPEFCTLASAALPDDILWTDIELDQDTLRFTEIETYPPETGQGEVQSSPTYEGVACSDVPDLAE